METNLRWAEKDCSTSAWYEDIAKVALEQTAVKNAPSKPNLTDEYEPTDPHLWDSCLQLVNGERRELTVDGRTVHAPNDGRGFRHMPNPRGVAWAVKQYNGFGAGWKRRKEDVTLTAHLRILAHGGVVTLKKGELDDLEQRGLVRLAGEAHGRLYWEATPRGHRVMMAGIVDELVNRMNALLEHFDAAEAKTLGEWLENNFRVSSPKTPSGGKELKGKLQRLIWVLKFRHGQSSVPDEGKIVEEIRRDWDAVAAQRQLLAKFTDEGGTVVPKDLEFEGVKYVNDAGVSQPNLEKYAKRLGAIFNAITGWRAKALVGSLVVKLKPPAEFRGTVAGKYKRDEDAMWVRTTPNVLRRAAGYASFEYILVHELGHRYERYHSLPTDFDKPVWHTTKYSREEGESFAELFALGHFGIKGSWDPAILDRFEDVMTGKRKV